MANHGKTNSQLFSEYLDLIAASKSVKWQYETKRVLGEFFSSIGEFPPTIELFTKFFQRYAKLAPSTRARYYYVFSAFFNWYDGQKIPFKVKAPKPLPQLVPDADIARLKGALETKRTQRALIERDLVLVDTIENTGLRRAEIADLLIGDLHLTGKEPFLHVRHGNGGKPRDVPLNPSITERLRVFTRGRKAGDNVFGLAAKTISMKIGQASRKAGVKIHTHGMRHKFATDILERGGNIRAVQKLLGHESLVTTEGYLAVTDEDLRNAVDLLSAEAGREGGRSGSSRGNVFTSSTEVEIALDDVTLDQFMRGPVEGDRYQHAPFVLKTRSARILIQSIALRTSSAGFPYRLLVFESVPRDTTVWDDEDLIGMEETQNKACVWAPGGPLEYTNGRGENEVHVALETSWRAMRFDLEGEELLRYFREPVRFTITLRYTV